jgi:hypothetical protein
MFELIRYPAPLPLSMYSKLMGFTCSYSSLLIAKVMPLSLKTSSSADGSSRTIPKEGPDQPPGAR